MYKVFAIARTEYLNAVRSKAFIIGIILMPLLMSGGIIANKLAEDSVDITDRTFGVIDPAGRLYPVIEAQAEERNKRMFEAVDDGEPKKIGPRFIPELLQPFESTVEEFNLAERVRDGELFAYVVIDLEPRAFDIGDDPLTEGDGGITYNTNTPTYSDLPYWLDEVISSAIRNERYRQQNDLDQGLVAKLNRRTNFTEKGLPRLDENGEFIEGEEQDKMRNQVIPAIGMFLLFMLVMMSAPSAFNVVLEEKMQKISEVLVAAVSPFQLMLGKILGTMLVSLTLSVLYLGAALVSTTVFGIEGLIPMHLYLWFLLFQILALLIFSSVYGAIGAACSEMRDAQNLMMPAMALVMLPFFFWMVVLESPNGTVSTLISLFPPATPMLMFLRVAIPPGPPLWELVLSIVLTVGFSIFCVYAGGKVFRIGLLSTGQAPSLRKLVGWVFSK